MNEGSSRPGLFLDSLIILILVLIIGFRNVVVLYRNMTYPSQILGFRIKE